MIRRDFKDLQPASKVHLGFWIDDDNDIVEVIKKDDELRMMYHTMYGESFINMGRGAKLDYTFLEYHRLLPNFKQYYKLCKLN